MRLDQIITEVNGDLQDCLAPVRSRFRLAMSVIFDYAVANPSQGSASTASTAIANTFKSTYADGLVSPGITIEAALTAFNNRHGGAGNANQKWVSVRDFIVARTAHKTRVAEWLEEGALPALPDLWHEKIAGNRIRGVPQAVDIVYTESRETTPGPTFNFIKERRWSSVSLGKTVRRVTTNTYDGTKVNRVEGPVEIV